MTKIDPHYVPEFMREIEDRVVTSVWQGGSTWTDFGVFHYNKTMLRVYDMRRVAESAIGWPVGDFTGLLQPDPLTKVQRGVDPGFYGSTAFQVYGSGAGFQIASNFLLWSADKPRHPANLCGAHFAYRWVDEDNSVRPWMRRGASARLRLAFDASLHHFHSTSADYVAYWVAAVWVKDVTTGKYFQWTFFVWKNQPNSIYESIGRDIGTPSIMVATAYRPSQIQKYSSTALNSAASYTGRIPDPIGTSGRYVSHISAEHIRTAATTYNMEIRASGQAVSVDPADYAVTLITLGPEMLIPDRPPNDDIFCHFGSAVENVQLSTVYKD